MTAVTTTGAGAAAAAPPVKHVVIPESTVRVNEMYRKSHDALATSNSIMVLTIGAMIILGSFFFFMFDRAKIRKTSVFGFVFSEPLIAVSTVCLIGVIVFGIFWNKEDDMNRLVPLLVVGLIVGVAIWAAINRGGDSVDPWSQEKINVDFEGIVADPERWAPYVVALIALVGVSAASVGGTLRMDKFRFYNEGFFALFVAIAVGAYSMCYVAGLMYKTAELLTSGFQKVAALYFGLVASLVFLVGLVMIAGERVGKLFYPRPHEDLNPTTVTQVGYDATQRTMSTLRWALVMVAIVPAILVWEVSPQMQFPADEKEKSGLVQEWSAVMAGFAVILLALPTIGILATEVSHVIPSFTTLLASLMAAYVMFVVGITGIKWSRDAAIVLASLFVCLLVAFGSGGLQKSTIGLSLLLAGMFLAVKFIGGKLTDFLDEILQKKGRSVSDNMRLIAWGGPVVIMSILWAARSYSLGLPYATPMLFLFFCAFYLLVFYYPDENIADREYINGAGVEVNTSIDFFVLFGVISVTIATSAMVMTMSGGIGERITGVRGGTPVAQAIFAFVAFVGISYGAAYLYNYAQTDAKFLDFVARSQDKLTPKFEDLSEDIYKAADWREILAKFGKDDDGCFADDKCPGRMTCDVKTGDCLSSHNNNTNP